MVFNTYEKYGIEYASTEESLIYNIRGYISPLHANQNITTFYTDF